MKNQILIKFDCMCLVFKNRSIVENEAIGKSIVSYQLFKKPAQNHFCKSFGN